MLVLCLTLFRYVFCIWYQSHVSKFMLIMHLNSCSKNLGHDRVVTYGVKVDPVTPCGLGNTTPQSGP